MGRFDTMCESAVAFSASSDVTKTVKPYFETDENESGG
jgi:hypothetical protein